MKISLLLFLQLGAQGASAFVVPSKKIALPQQKKSTFFRATIEEKAEDTAVVDAFTTETSSSSLTTGIPYNELTIGVMKETYPGENRVSQTPDSVATLVKAGFNVAVQAGGTRNWMNIHLF